MKILDFAGAFVLAACVLQAADQTQVGAGNGIATNIGRLSPLVQSAKILLGANALAIQDANIRKITLDGFTNPNTCVAHRANVTDAMKNTIVQTLINQGLVNPADAASIQGGVKAGVFPPILGDGTACPHLPLTFEATPGSNFGSHHSYPGGLAVHESLNQQSAKNFADTYRGEFGQPKFFGLPIAEGTAPSGDIQISQDVILAAPIWHDWAKTMVFQWNADGTEFTELNFGGAGTADAYGAAGDSRTGGHHIIGVAETMARGLPPILVITQACAHSAPTLGNEFKVVNWLRAAAIIAQVDPVAKGYLVKDSSGNLRLPPINQLANNVNLLDEGQSNLLIEYQIHNLSDADFVNSIPAITIAQVLLQTIAPQFGYNPSDTANYNNKFRNVALANLGAERLEVLYANSGIGAVTKEVQKLRSLGIL